MQQRSTTYGTHWRSRRLLLWFAAAGQLLCPVIRRSLSHPIKRHITHDWLNPHWHTHWHNKHTHTSARLSWIVMISCSTFFGDHCVSVRNRFFSSWNCSLDEEETSSTLFGWWLVSTVLFRAPHWSAPRCFVSPQTDMYNGGAGAIHHRVTKDAECPVTSRRDDLVPSLNAI